MRHDWEKLHTHQGFVRHATSCSAVQVHIHGWHDTDDTVQAVLGAAIMLSLLHSGWTFTTKNAFTSPAGQWRVACLTGLIVYC